MRVFNTDCCLCPTRHASADAKYSALLSFTRSTKYAWEIGGVFRRYVYVGLWCTRGEAPCRCGGCITTPGEATDNVEHDEGDCFDKARRAS